jgi:hypothetical protein
MRRNPRRRRLFGMVTYWRISWLCRTACILATLALVLATVLVHPMSRDGFRTIIVLVLATSPLWVSLVVVIDLVVILIAGRRSFLAPRAHGSTVLRALGADIATVAAVGAILAAERILPV